MHEYAQTSQTSFFSLCMHYLSHCLEDGFHTQIFDSSNTLIQQSILFVTKSTYQRQPFLCPLYCKSHVCMFQSPRLYQMLWNNIMLAFLNNMVKFSQYSHFSNLTWVRYICIHIISWIACFPVSVSFSVWYLSTMGREWECSIPMCSWPCAIPSDKLWHFTHIPLVLKGHELNPSFFIMNLVVITRCMLLSD